MDDLKLEIGEAVIFTAPDGYPDRARFLGMQGDLYQIRYRGSASCASGDYTVPRSTIIDVVRPKPVAYAERP